MKPDIKNLIQRYSEGDISLKDQIELSEQLADSENSNAEEILRQDWQAELASVNIPDHNLNPLLDRVHHQIRLEETKIKKQPNWLTTFQRIAAVLIVPMLFSFLAYYYLQSKKASGEGSYAEIQCPLGVRTKFELPDGSTGFLNSGSRLRYPVRFTNQRRVELTGEAYFDVAHNAEVPFHVKTRNLDIKVLGTTFNVIANDDEPTEEIILQTGKLDVSSPDGKKLDVMKPNEQITLDIQKNILVKNQVEASQYTSWKDGKLVFRNENMQQVARRLSRWYNAEVLADDRMLDDFTFHATFKDEPLDEVLKLLSITTPLSYKEEKRVSNQDGLFQKRKVFIRINHSKISQFK